LFVKHSVYFEKSQRVKMIR